MGMYTKIIHPGDGRELQIKTGDDDLDTYSVGDKVDLHVDPNWYGSGCCFDGVYQSYSTQGEDDWVIICGGAVTSVLIKLIDYEDVLFTALNLKSYHPGPQPEWYTQKALEEHQRIVAEVEEDCKRFQATIVHLSPTEQASAWMARAFSTRIDYVGLSRKFIEVTPMDNSKQIRFKD